MMAREREIPEEIRGPVFYFGIVLVVTGAVALIYLAISVVQILQSPADASIVKWVLETVAESEVILAGHINDEPFEFRASEPFQYMFLSVLGLMMVSLLTAIFSNLLRGGLQLMRMSHDSDKDGPR